MNANAHMVPGFSAEAVLYRTKYHYKGAGRVTHNALAPGVTPQFGKSLMCAVYAGLCLAASENPPAAAYCWWDFARRCGGALA